LHKSLPANEANRYFNIGLEHLEEFSRMYTSVPFGADPCDGYLTYLVEKEIIEGAMNWKANPSTPVCYRASSNRDALSTHYPYVVAATISVARKLRDTPHEEVKKMTRVELVENGLTCTHRVMIKDEPHSETKIQAGRLRIVVSVSLIMQLIERILYHPQQLQNIKDWKKIPNKIGMSFSPIDSQFLWDLVENFRRQTGKSVDFKDVSYWDWSLEEWALSLDAELIILLRKCANTKWENMIRNCYHVMMNTILCTSDGEMYSTIVPGIRVSGSFITGESNSRIRSLFAHILRWEQGYKGNLFTITMGDDSGEEETEVDYSKLGLLISLDERSKLGEEFSFCSHTFKDGRAVPENWAKSTYRFIVSADGDQEQFKSEMKMLDGSTGASYDELMLLLQSLGLLKEH